MSKSAEQQARDILERCGVEEAQSFTAGDVVELANLVAMAEAACEALKPIREARGLRRTRLLRIQHDGGPVTGETENSDFYGIVLNAAVAAMDGCPWVEKGRGLQVADGIAETVADRIGQVDSFLLPDEQRFVRDNVSNNQDCAR